MNDFLLTPEQAEQQQQLQAQALLAQEKQLYLNQFQQQDDLSSFGLTAIEGAPQTRKGEVILGYGGFGTESNEMNEPTNQMIDNIHISNISHRNSLDEKLNHSVYSAFMNTSHYGKLAEEANMRLEGDQVRFNLGTGPSSSHNLHPEFLHSAKFGPASFRGTPNLSGAPSKAVISRGESEENFLGSPETGKPSLPFAIHQQDRPLFQPSHPPPMNFGGLVSSQENYQSVLEEHSKNHFNNLPAKGEKVPNAPSLKLKRFTNQKSMRMNYVEQDPSLKKRKVRISNVVGDHVGEVEDLEEDVVRQESKDTLPSHSLRASGEDYGGEEEASINSGSDAHERVIRELDCIKRDLDRNRKVKKDLFNCQVIDWLRPQQHQTKQISGSQAYLNEVYEKLSRCPIEGMDEIFFNPKKSCHEEQFKNFKSMLGNLDRIADEEKEKSMNINQFTEDILQQINSLRIQTGQKTLYPSIFSNLHADLPAVAQQDTARSIEDDDPFSQQIRLEEQQKELLFGGGQVGRAKGFFGTKARQQQQDMKFDLVDSGSFIPGNPQGTKNQMTAFGVSPSQQSFSNAPPAMGMVGGMMPMGMNFRDHFDPWHKGPYTDLDKNEMRIKDAQIRRLQNKVKQFSKTEKALQSKIQTTKKRDEHLVKKISQSISFSKVFVAQSSHRYRTQDGIYKAKNFRELYKGIKLLAEGDEGEEEESAEFNRDGISMQNDTFNSADSLKTSLIDDSPSLQDSEMVREQEEEFARIAHQFKVFFEDSKTEAKDFIKHDHLKFTKVYMQLQAESEEQTEGLHSEGQESGKQSSVRQEGLVLNFYRDAYMMAEAFEAGTKSEHTRVPSSIPLSSLDVVNLDTQLTRVVDKDKSDPEELNFLQLFAFDEDNSIRRTYIVGIVGKEQLEKWLMCLCQAQLPHNRIDKALVALKQEVCLRKKLKYLGEHFRLDSDSESETDSNDIISQLNKTYKSMLKKNPKLASSMTGTSSPFQPSFSQAAKAVTPFNSQPLGIIDEQLSQSPKSQQSMPNSVIDNDALTQSDLKKTPATNQRSGDLGFSMKPGLMYNKAPISTPPTNEMSDQASNFGNLGRERQNQKKKAHEAEMQRKAHAYKELLNGQVFLKYGKYGFPKQKHVFFDGKAIRWRANTTEGHDKIEKSTAINSNKKKRIILVDSQGKAADIEIEEGRRNEKSVFKRFKVGEEISQLSFRIIQKQKGGKNGRELCLQAASVEEMQAFIRNIRIVLADLRSKQKSDFKTVIHAKSEPPPLPKENHFDEVLKQN